MMRSRGKAARKRARAAADKPPEPPSLSPYIVAYFGGKYDAVQSPFTNYHRALGCERTSDFRKLSPEEDSERHRKAIARIFKRRGVDLDTAPWEAVEPVLMKLVKQLAKSKMPVPASAV